MAKLNDTYIRNALSSVTDPDIGKTLGELDAIEKIEVGDNMINISLRLIQPIHLAAEKINCLCADKLKEIAPDYENQITFSEKEWPGHGGEYLKGVKNIIAVASGKGGVGKSAVASNLAAAISLTGARVGILDGDVYGPSQPTMFGMEDVKIYASQQEDGTPIVHPAEHYGIKVASMGFFVSKQQAAIVRGPMLAKYFSMLFEQVEWGALDYLIFDLPPGTGDIQLTLTQNIPLTGAVVVTTPQEISVVDVRRSISMFRKVNVDIIGIVENMSYFVPPDMPDKKYYIFGEGGGKSIAKESEVDFLGEIPLSIDMRKGNDGGKPYVLEDNAGEQGERIKEVTANIISHVRKLNAAKEDSGTSIEI